MSKRITIGLLASVVVLCLLAGGVYAYDHSYSDVIPRGVKVAGVDVGGLHADAARDRLAAELMPSLQRAVRVKALGRGYTLRAQTAGVRVDLDELVAIAVAGGQNDWIGGRVWRELTKARVDKNIAPTVHYSPRAVRRFVADIGADVNRAPVDASLTFSVSSLNIRQSSSGRQLLSGRLRRQVARTLRSTSRSRVLRARVKVVAPKVATSDVAQKYPTVVTVDRAAFTVRLFKNLKLAKTYQVAVGAEGHETSPGLYNVQTMQVDPVWSVPNSDWAGDLAGKTIPAGDPKNPLVARFIGFNGAQGFHGTKTLDSIGSAASHGCIRMRPVDVIDLYKRVSIGIPVYIT